MSVSSVSRLVADLEAHLGARLLNRTTRRLSLTEAGRTFHEHGVQLLADLEEAEASASAEAVVPRGTLRITCGTDLRQCASCRARWRRSWRRHPQVRFDVELSDRMSRSRGRGLRRRGAHRRIRARATSSVDASAPPRSCAAPRPAYLARHGEPRTPEDLAQHPCLLYQYASQRDVWTFDGPDGQSASDPRERARVSRTAAASSRRSPREGAGITYEPDFAVGPDVRAGDARADPARVFATLGADPRRCIRAAGTCRPRCARSRSSSRSASPFPNGRWGRVAEGPSAQVTIATRRARYYRTSPPLRPLAMPRTATKCTPVVRAVKPRTKTKSKATAKSATTPADFRLLDAYWRAANYLSVGQIYLFDNPLLRKPLQARAHQAAAARATGAPRRASTSSTRT